MDNKQSRPSIPKLKLYGFNNLAKSLSFSIYDIKYTSSQAAQARYQNYISQHYNTNRLGKVLLDVCQIIGATPLNIAQQEYDPQGASVTMLVAEQAMATTDAFEQSEHPGPVPQAIVSHLDKSHICIHTYPESHENNGISIFRADIDVSSCGVISPLKALNFMIQTFNAAVVIVDYRVRGFTRDVKGHKHFIDHKINSIQNFLATDSCQLYQMADINFPNQNLFHTKMMLKDFDLTDWMFEKPQNMSSTRQNIDICTQLKQEMLDIYTHE